MYGRHETVYLAVNSLEQIWCRKDDTSSIVILVPPNCSCSASLSSCKQFSKWQQQNDWDRPSNLAIYSYLARWSSVKFRCGEIITTSVHETFLRICIDRQPAWKPRCAGRYEVNASCSSLSWSFTTSSINISSRPCDIWFVVIIITVTHLNFLSRRFNLSFSNNSLTTVDSSRCSLSVLFSWPSWPPLLPWRAISHLIPPRSPMHQAVVVSRLLAALAHTLLRVN